MYISVTSLLILCEHPSLRSIQLKSNYQLLLWFIGISSVGIVISLISPFSSIGISHFFSIGIGHFFFIEISPLFP